MSNSDKKTKLFRFNVKNVMYAIKSSNGTYESPIDLAYANSISLEADYNETKLYGDGEVLAVLGDDKGKTGTLSVTNIEKHYEIAMKRAMEIENGLADIQQRSSVEHAIYFETDGLLDGKSITIKNWLLNVTTGKASESYEQTKDSPTINNYDYSMSVLGTNLQNAEGTSDYYDENGNAIKVYRITSFPGDTGYDTFENSVPVPKAKS